MTSRLVVVSWKSIDGHKGNGLIVRVNVEIKLNHFTDISTVRCGGEAHVVDNDTKTANFDHHALSAVQGLLRHCSRGMVRASTLPKMLGSLGPVHGHNRTISTGFNNLKVKSSVWKSDEACGISRRPC